MKGIILAGGTGSRMYPMTVPTVKQLLPIYDKPMIYYPLSVLMLAGIREILLISTQRDLPRYIDLLGDGSQIGLKMSYSIQKSPRGLPEAFIIAEQFIAGDSVMMILGDNLFFGERLQTELENVMKHDDGATIFAYRVNDPERYGVVEFDHQDKIVSIEEKPEVAKSKYAVTGLYCFDKKVTEYAKTLRPSSRNELEILDLAKIYLDQGKLNVKKLGGGFAWLDTGTQDALFDASNFVKVLQTRQGTYVACIEEIAYRQGFIDKSQLESTAQSLNKTPYGKYLLDLLKE